VEDPGYGFTAAAFHLEGAAVTHVPIDSHGFPAAAVAQLGPKVCIVSPAHQFPSGIVMPRQRREALLQAAAQAGTWIVEDDYDGDLGSIGLRHAALKSLDSEERVFHVGSFSKTLFPGLRLAFVVPPRLLRLDLVAAKAYLDLGCSTLDQATVAHFMRSGAFERHLTRTAQELRRRRRLAIGAIQEGLGAAVRVEDHGAPMHFIAWLPGRSEEEVQRLIAAAGSRGLALYSVAPHFHGTPPCAGLMIGVARLAPKQIPDAMRILCSCVRESFHGPSVGE
jgi:GntR family transcriptional regulator/MocR family aminotransferase